MSVKQMEVVIPPEIEDGINKGLLELYGSIVRRACGPGKGQIVAHLKTIEHGDDIRKQAARSVGVFTKYKTVIIVGVCGLVGVGVSAVGIALYHKFGPPAVVNRFNSALKAYTNALKNGELEVDQITEMKDSLAALQNLEKFKVKISIQQMNELVDIIRDYTIWLAKTNSYKLPVEEVEEQRVSGNNVVDLTKYLDIQKTIFETA